MNLIQNRIISSKKARNLMSQSVSKVIYYEAYHEERVYFNANSAKNLSFLLTKVCRVFLNEQRLWIHTGSEK
jgi:hypothetical protein